jgi:hypothetical protein
MKFIRLNDTRIPRTAEAIAQEQEVLALPDHNTNWEPAMVREYGEKMMMQGLILASEIVGAHIDSNGHIKNVDHVLSEIYKLIARNKEK